MPSVKLTKYECREDLLPVVCMFCGEHATSRKQRSYAWHPPWVWALIIFGVLVEAIVALVLTKRMTVRVPVCDRHEGFWRRKALTLWLSFLAIVAGSIGISFLMDGQGQRNDDVTGWLCMGMVFLAWLVVAVVYTTRGVRPTEITDRFIRLTGVNQEFVDALEDDRAQDREEEDAFRRERRAKRLAREQERRDEEPPPRQKYERDDDLERRARD